jgi:hypothetical protein
MERSRFSTIGTLFTATLLAGAVLLGGCSDSLTGPTPPDTQEQMTVDQPQHNTQNDGGTDTDPVAGHNTSDED